MSDDDVGIFRELQQRTKRFAAQGAAVRRRILGAGPAKNGAYAQLRNPFMDPGFHVPGLQEVPFWVDKTEAQMARRRAAAPPGDPDLADANVVQIVQAVARASMTTPGELLGRKRDKRLALPRHVAIHLIAMLCPGYSLNQIGFMFQRDHTTIFYAIRIVPERLKQGCEITVPIVAKALQLLRDGR